VSSSDRFAAPVVVCKFDPNVMHHGGLGATRSLGRLGVAVHGIHEHRAAPAAGSRYLARRWFWRPDPEDVDATRDGLRAIGERIGAPAVVLPTDDAAAIFLAEHGDDLRESFLFPSPPAGLPRRLAGKASLYRLCGELGMPCPRSQVPDGLSEAEEFAAGTGYPLVAKLTEPWLAGGPDGPRSTTIVHSRDELAEMHRAAGPGRLLLQEFIPATPGCDWFFHGYADASSSFLAAFTGVKDRSYPARAGLTSRGRWVPNERLAREVSGFLARVGYRGIVDLDVRFDARDGQYKLLDANPRLGAQFRLFADAAGLDVVRAQYLDLTGQRPGAGEPLPGRTFLVESYDPLAALRYWRSGELTAREWLSSLRGADETAWFATDDPVPFGLMCARMAGRAVTRPAAARLRRTLPSQSQELRRGPERATTTEGA
jgi:predicted ATP-grasp superfamily ATP-dependent carboligase